MKVTCVSVLTTAALLLFSGAASAQCPPGAPNGDSGVDEYTESIPGAAATRAPVGIRAATAPAPTRFRTRPPISCSRSASTALLQQPWPKQAHPMSSTATGPQERRLGEERRRQRRRTHLGLTAAASTAEASFTPAGSSLSAMVGALAAIRAAPVRASPGPARGAAAGPADSAAAASQPLSQLSP